MRENRPRGRIARGGRADAAPGDRRIAPLPTLHHHEMAAGRQVLHTVAGRFRQNVTPALGESDRP